MKPTVIIINSLSINHSFNFFKNKLLLLLMTLSLKLSEFLGACKFQ